MNSEMYEAFVTTRWAEKGRAAARKLINSSMARSEDFELADILNNLAAIAERQAKAAAGIEGE